MKGSSCEDPPTAHSAAYLPGRVTAGGSRRWAFRRPLEVNGRYVHRHDNETNTLRAATLCLFFDDMFVLSEAEIRGADALHDMIRQRIFETR